MRRGWIFALSSRQCSTLTPRLTACCLELQLTACCFMHHLTACCLRVLPRHVALCCGSEPGCARWGKGREAFDNEPVLGQVSRGQVWWEAGLPHTSFLLSLFQRSLSIPSVLFLVQSFVFFSLCLFFSLCQCKGRSLMLSLLCFACSCSPQHTFACECPTGHCILAGRLQTQPK